MYEWLCAGTLISLFVVIALFVAGAAYVVSPWIGLVLIPIGFALVALGVKVKEELL